MINAVARRITELLQPESIDQKFRFPLDKYDDLEGSGGIMVHGEESKN